MKKGGAKTVVGGRILVNTSVLAGMLKIVEGRKIAARTIRHWAAADGMPKLSQDRYDVAAVWAWHEERKVKEHRPAAGDAAELVKFQAAQKKAQSEIAEMKAAEMRGELLDRTEVEREWISFVIANKTALMYLPESVSRDLEGVEETGERREIVRKGIYACLERLANREEQAEAGLALTANIARRTADKLVMVKNAATVGKIIRDTLGSDPWGAEER